ncbi:MAG: protein CpxP [Maribacter sp.]|jgi:protein CpxP
MKKGLKFVVATFVLAIIFNSSAMAQRGGQDGESPAKGERPSPEERAEKQLEKLTKKLDLSDYQVDQIAYLNTDLISQAETIKDGDLEREQKREEMKALMNGMNNEIKALLDDTQLDKFEKMLAKREEKGNKGNRPHPRGE